MKPAFELPGLDVLQSKIFSARHQISYAIEQFRIGRHEASKRRMFERWLNELKQHPPDVLVGSNFADFGGVRHHIHAIQRYSSLRVELAPSDSLMKHVSAHEIANSFRQNFNDFRPPSGLKAIHSHVFPWFVQWSRRVKGTGPLWIHTYHAPYFRDEGSSALLPWQEQFNAVSYGDASHADVRISVSRWQQRYLRDEHAIQTRYLPNGVDVGLCDRADPNRFRRKFQRGEFVLYVGRDEPVKNPADFVKLAGRLPEMNFVMIGQGLGKDTWPARDVAVPHNLSPLGDTSHMGTLDAIAACSALVVTSKREGLPTVVLEAMALGKPVVVPDDPGCVEALGRRDLGYVYAPSDIADLSEKTLAALDESSSPDRRAHVVAEYDWRVIAPKLDAIYSGRDVST